MTQAKSIVERAAEAHWNTDPTVAPWAAQFSVVQDAHAKRMRTALLSALEPTDEVVRVMVKRMIIEAYGENHPVAAVALNTRYEEFARQARAALSALRAIVEGQTP